MKSIAHDISCGGAASPGSVAGRSFFRSHGGCRRSRCLRDELDPRTATKRSDVADQRNTGYAAGTLSARSAGGAARRLVPDRADAPLLCTRRRTRACPDTCQARATRVLDDMEADIRLVIENSGPDADYDRGHQLVYEKAKNHPIDPSFASRRGSAVFLAEFTANAGGSALRSIGSITETVEDLVARIDLNAEYIPKFARWQAMLFALDGGYETRPRQRRKPRVPRVRRRRGRATITARGGAAGSRGVGTRSGSHCTRRVSFEDARVRQPAASRP